MSVEPRRLHELPPFDPGTIEIVRASVNRLPSNPVELTREFYRQLFLMAPQARALFAEDLTEQTERLLSAILAAVRALDRPELVENHLRRWGVVHRRVHGISDDLYVYVGHSLVRALHAIFGHLETSVSSAWIAVYEWMAAVMIDGADYADSIDRDPSAIIPQERFESPTRSQPVEKASNVLPFRSKTGVA